MRGKKKAATLTVTAFRLFFDYLGERRLVLSGSVGS